MRIATHRLPHLLAAVLLLSTGLARAADRWIQADSATPAPGQEISVRLFEGKPFAGVELSSAQASPALLQRVWRQGRANLTDRQDRKAAAAFSVVEPGVQLIVYSAADSASFCKTLVVVGDARQDDPVRYSELGQRVEIVPQSDPVRLLREGGTLEVQVLFEREPLAGARVMAFPAAAPQEGLEAAITDEIGLATLKLGRPGWWMIRVRHQPRAEYGRPAERTSISSTLVLAAGVVD